MKKGRKYTSAAELRNTFPRVSRGQSLGQEGAND